MHTTIYMDVKFIIYPWITKIKWVLLLLDIWLPHTKCTTVGWCQMAHKWLKNLIFVNFKVRNFFFGKKKEYLRWQNFDKKILYYIIFWAAISIEFLKLNFFPKKNFWRSKFVFFALNNRFLKIAMVRPSSMWRLDFDMFFSVKYNKITWNDKFFRKFQSKRKTILNPNLL